MSWVLASFLVLGLALAAGFAWYERSHPTARVLALVATLAALAALGRIAFAPLPSVKPTTDIVLLTGYVLGGAPGFAVGAVGALASNLFFGQGPWTPWQMVGWGGAGVIGAVLARVAGRDLGRFALASACALASLAFGVVMNLHLWVTFSGDHTLSKLGYYFATSLAFDLAHAIGSFAFCLAFGPALVRALRRYRMRFEVEWRPAPAAAAVVAALLALVLLAPPRADAAVPSAAVRYLEQAQNADGGLGPAPGSGSTQMHTAWAALGLAAAGRNPRDVERGGVSIVDYMRANAGRLRGDLGERTRTMLALRAAGLPPGRLGGRDLLGELLREQEDDGSFAGRVNTTAFAILALRAAGPHVPRPRDPRRRRVHRRPGQRRRRLQLQRARRTVGRRRHRLGHAGARRRGPPRLAGDEARGALAPRASEPGRRVLAPGRPEQRAVHRMGGAGPGRGRARSRRGCGAAARGRRSPTCARSWAPTARSATRAPAPRRRCGSPARS